MAARIYKPTLLQRATIKRESRLVLDAEPDAPPNSYRLVQVLNSDVLFMGFEDTGNPLEHAGGRDYNMIRIPDFGTIAPFVMLPQQELYLMAEYNAGVDHASLVFASLIVQYFQEM